MNLFRYFGLGGILWVIAVLFSANIALDELSSRLTWDRINVHVTDAGDPADERDAILTLNWFASDGSTAQLEATRRELGGDFRHVAEGETLSVLSNPEEFGDLHTPMLFGSLYLYLGIMFFGLWRLAPLGNRSPVGRTEIDPFDPLGISKSDRKRGLSQLSVKLVVLGLYGIGFAILSDNHRAGKAATYSAAEAQVTSVDRRCRLEWTTGIFPFRDTERSPKMDCDIAQSQADRSDAVLIPDHVYMLAYTHPRQGVQAKKVFQSFMKDEQPSTGETMQIMMHPHRGQSIERYDRVNGGRSWGFILGSALWSVIFALIAYIYWPKGPAPAPKRSRTRSQKPIKRPVQPRSPQQPHPW